MSIRDLLEDRNDEYRKSGLNILKLYGSKIRKALMLYEGLDNGISIQHLDVVPETKACIMVSYIHNILPGTVVVSGDERFVLGDAEIEYLNSVPITVVLPVHLVDYGSEEDIVDAINKNDDHIKQYGIESFAEYVKNYKAPEILKETRVLH